MRNKYKSIRDTVNLLIGNFRQCLDAFDESPPFSKYGQFEYHQQTIQQRLALGSAAVALTDDTFLESLYRTLQAWGIGARGSRLRPLSHIKSELLNYSSEIVALDEVAIDSSELDIQRTSARLWQLIDTLAIVENKAKLVAGSKALHHILPNLVVPIDRAYTGYFFEWKDMDFQNNQKRCFTVGFEAFARIARETNPVQRVGKGWHTSKTKVIDNAIVGYKLYLRRLALSSLENHGPTEE